MSVRIGRYRGTSDWEVDIRVRLPDGRKHRERRRFDGKSRTLALEWGEKRIAHLLRFGLEEKKPEVPGLQDFQDRFFEWLEANRLKASTITNRKSNFRCHLLPAFAARKLDSFRPADVETLKMRLKHIKPGSAQRVLESFAAVLRAAVSLGLVDERQVPKVESIGAPRNKAPPMPTEDEYERLLLAAAQMPDWRIELILLLAGDAGLRKGEIRCLRWKHIDLKAGVLVVEENAFGNIIDSTKGNKAGAIPLTPRLKEALEKRRGLPAAFVIRSARTGGMVSEGGVWTLMDRLRKAAEADGRGRVHVFRHSFCSRLAHRGAGAADIRDAARHADLSTSSGYVHLAGGRLASVIATLQPKERPSVDIPSIDGPRTIGEK
jgi:integrase